MRERAVYVRGTIVGHAGDWPVVEFTDDEGRTIGEPIAVRPTDVIPAEVTDEMVEAAARALWMRDSSQLHSTLTLKDLRDAVQRYRSRARAALTAALSATQVGVAEPKPSGDPSEHRAQLEREEAGEQLALEIA